MISSPRHHTTPFNSSSQSLHSSFINFNCHLPLQFKLSFLTPSKHFPLHSHTTVKFRFVSTVITTHEVVIVDSDTLNSNSNELGFVNIGHISSVHGLQSKICVKPVTDFPQLRFSTPGRRWLKRKAMGEETIQQVELEEGREHPGLKSWILKFRGIDTLEQAKMLIGATLLVTEEDRPELEEDEFYTNDLTGMRVFMKKNGKFLGSGINVFNSGVNDLLQISLDPSFDILDKSGKPRLAEIRRSRDTVSALLNSYL